jgi:hypothetical protein
MRRGRLRRILGRMTQSQCRLHPLAARWHNDGVCVLCRSGSSGGEKRSESDFERSGMTSWRRASPLAKMRLLPKPIFLPKTLERLPIHLAGLSASRGCALARPHGMNLLAAAKLHAYRKNIAETNPFPIQFSGAGACRWAVPDQAERTVLSPGNGGAVRLRR